MITLTQKDAIIAIWAAFVWLVLGVLMIFLLNIGESYGFVPIPVALIGLARVSYPKPRPKPHRIIFPNNRFLRWTFYSLYLFLAAHVIWQGWKIFFSG